MTSAINFSRRAPMRRAPVGVPPGRASSVDVCGVSRYTARHRNTVRRETPSRVEARVTWSESSSPFSRSAMTASLRRARSHWASVACTTDCTGATVASKSAGGARSFEAEVVDNPPLARSRTTPNRQPATQPKLVTPVLQVVHRVITRHLLGQAGLKADEADSGALHDCCPGADGQPNP